MSRQATNFIHALAAVLAGNAVYFLLARYLPLAARHDPFRIDLGMVVDFSICLVAFVIIKAIAGQKREPSDRPRG
jgi:hypothetical protein